MIWCWPRSRSSASSLLTLIVKAPFGRRLIAIREDDGLAETLGINVTRQKLFAFFIGSMFASIGGALYAPYVGFISPRGFDVLVSLNIWLMVAFGGRGTIWGPVIGAVLLAPIPFLLQDYYTIKDVVYGLLIIGVIVLLPPASRAASSARRVPRRARRSWSARDESARCQRRVDALRRRHRLARFDVTQDANETLGMIGPKAGQDHLRQRGDRPSEIRARTDPLRWGAVPRPPPVQDASAGLTRILPAVRVFGAHGP